MESSEHLDNGEATSLERNGEESSAPRTNIQTGVTALPHELRPETFVILDKRPMRM